MSFKKGKKESFPVISEPEIDPEEEENNYPKSLF